MVDAIILCGGRGTRLAGVVHDVPKPLAPVLGRPFLDHLVDRLAASGEISSVTLAVHHLAERIFEYYREHPASLPVQFVREETLLGTGGALFNALRSVASDPVICLNGDSLVGGDLTALVSAHRTWGPGFTVGLVSVPDTSRYGSVELAADGRITGFYEKTAAGGAGLINAGIYVIDREILGPWSEQPVSIEVDLLPRLVREGCVRGIVLDGPFIDIGIPETYAAASSFLENFSNIRSAARP